MLNATSMSKALEGLNLFERIKEHTSAPTILYDGSAAEFIRQNTDRILGVICHPIDVAMQGGEHKAESTDIIVVSLEDEANLVSHIRNRRGLRVHGLVGGWALALSLGLQHPDQISALDQTKTRTPHLNYAVVCTARSGSSWLCSLLRSTGILGTPKEHLRPPVVLMAQHEDVIGLAFRNWLDHAPIAFQTDGVFGTKIIDNFVADFWPHLTVDAAQHVTDALAGFKIIHLERTDKCMQAVSEYFARNTNIWHLRDGRSPDGHRDARDKLDYDFRALEAIFARFVTNEERVRSAIARSGNASIHLTYEALEADPVGEVRRIAAFLTGEDMTELSVHQERYKKMADHLNITFAERLRADLKRG